MCVSETESVCGVCVRVIVRVLGKRCRQGVLMKRRESVFVCVRAQHLFHKSYLVPQGYCRTPLAIDIREF